MFLEIKKSCLRANEALKDTKYTFLSYSVDSLKSISLEKQYFLYMKMCHITLSLGGEGGGVIL